ncbi:hypothetical protein R3P38DRAFT_1370950 [Favolaschia claudopus]|uniref:Uncharacterized protein n=1 Tax=Favolaschia claudopus TaxID=2862362 RepID=A0AAW0DWS1_9AGAR
MDNTATLCDILCAEEAWHWDTYDGHKLIFHRDGTGVITSHAELNIWIYAIFEWKVHDPANSVHHTPHPHPTPPRPCALGSIMRKLLTIFRRPTPPELRASIEFTLTERRPNVPSHPSFSLSKENLNEYFLLPIAFEPRILHLTVERNGCFPAGFGSVPQRRSRFRSRLTFDVSPYPARQAWREHCLKMVDSMGQPGMRRFCAGKLASQGGHCGWLPAGCNS